MRKSFSSLVLLAMLLTTTAPLLALAPQPLPACCRADGQHHCAALMSLGGEGFRAQMPPCPFRGHPAVAPACSALQGQRVTFAIAPISSQLRLAAARTAYSTPRYSLPKRGPPLS